MTLRVSGLETSVVQRVQQGGLDANGNRAVEHRFSGIGNPCRHCLELIEEDKPLLVLGWRPFPKAQPYAEVGPIFLHKESCERYSGDSFPDWFSFLDPAVVRGYDSNDWIRYDTGSLVPGHELLERCQEILAMVGIEYVHVRSKFGCFLCSVTRA